MWLVAPLFAVAVVAAPYTLDLSRYFPGAAAEQADLARLLAAVETFEKTPASSIPTADALAKWLSAYDGLSKDLQRHDLYVYLRAERDQQDKPDAAADDALGVQITDLDAAAANTLAALGAARLQADLKTDVALASYAHFIDSTLANAAHDSRNRGAVEALAQPALNSLSSAYKALRRHALSTTGAAPLDAKGAFEAKWAPFLQNEDAFAAVLLPIAVVQNGKARLQGFADAPDAAYARAGLSSDEVGAVLAAVKASDAYKAYRAVVGAAAARRAHLGPAQPHSWDLSSADDFAPPATPFPDAVALVLSAEQPMGEAYTAEYARLFDPKAHRVDWCGDPACDETGFSVGFAGLTSGLFYGNYRGATDNIRAVAHEAGHAAHRQFMSENQPLAVYNKGPHFLFESFAIFNELLLLDHLYRSAPTPAAKAYYLHAFLDDITFQVFGSAQETDLEQSIYAGAQSGSLRSAADLDKLTLEIFARYDAAPEPETKVYWARNRLYFTDPLYDANYLFAGLLALEYWRRYEQDPKGFADRYVALLKTGINDTPQALERKFLDIDLDDGQKLVAEGAEVIRSRTTDLSALYAASK